MMQKEDMPLLKQATFIGGVKIITGKDINETLVDATDLKRLRAAIAIHDNFQEIPQRFVNCLREGSYVRPHMHVVPNQWELMTWLDGEVVAVFFDDYGKVLHKIVMSEGKTKIMEIPPFSYHTFYVRNQGAYLEVRNCKYQPNVDRVYAAWAPPQESAIAKAYYQRLLTTEVGDVLTAT